MAPHAHYNHYLQDEEADMIVENMRKEDKRKLKWKESQPEYIAVEMTNAEVTSLWAANSFIGITFNNFLQMHRHSVRLYDDKKLCKKVINPKTQGVKVIPW